MSVDSGEVTFCFAASEVFVGKFSDTSLFCYTISSLLFLKYILIVVITLCCILNGFLSSPSCFFIVNNNFNIFNTCWCREFVQLLLC